MSSDRSAHERIIDGVMAKVFRREGHTFVPKAEQTPLDALLEQEGNGADSSSAALRISEEAIDWMLGWTVDGDPHPIRMARRLLALTRARKYDLLLGSELSGPPGTFELRFVILMGQIFADEDELLKILSKVFRRHGRTYTAATSATAQQDLYSLEQWDTEEELEQASVAYDRVLEWLWADGPKLVTAMKRLFFLLRTVRPELILNMSGGEIAALFGQGRAAEQARCDLLLGKLKKAGGYRTLALPFQKSATARQKCAKAQQGNRNRSTGSRQAAEGARAAA